LLDGESSRVLLVEDNQVNIRLALNVLGKMGCEVVHAANGREAVAAAESDTFDLILMDLQMPEMGGLEATRIIRERECRQGRHTPIVAMTAHAMPEDRARCLEAGMDDYISKPVRSKLLRELVFTLASGESTEQIQASEGSLDADPSSCASTEEPPLDLEEALSYLEGDRDVLEAALMGFLESTPGLLDELELAVRSRDEDGVRALAHSLKGAAAAICAGPVRSAAERLELRGSDMPAGDLESYVERLRESADVLLVAVRSCLGGSGT
jgi:CheY-like chemotaxis protein